MRTDFFVLAGNGEAYTVILLLLIHSEPRHGNKRYIPASSVSSAASSALLSSEWIKLVVGAATAAAVWFRCWEARKGFPDMVKVRNNTLFYLHEECLRAAVERAGPRKEVLADGRLCRSFADMLEQISEMSQHRGPTAASHHSERLAASSFQHLLRTLSGHSARPTCIPSCHRSARRVWFLDWQDMWTATDNTDNTDRKLE